MSKIELCEGKYTVTHENGINLTAHRYGEPWRDLAGDGLILAMAQRIEELENPEINKEELREAIEIIGYKYFGDYPLSDIQYEAVCTLVDFVKKVISKEEQQ